MATLFEAVAPRVQALHQLLGSDFLKEGASTPIGKTIGRVFQLANEKKMDESRYHFDILGALIWDLENIKRNDAKLFKTYRRKLNNSLDMDAYFGARFEIAIASGLIRTNSNFERVRETDLETPDFAVHGNSDCYIECASAHLSKPKPKDLEYKINSVIDGKSKKSYSDKNTVLFVDISNIIHYSLMFRMPIHNRLKEIVDKKVVTSGFGSVILFMFMFETQTHGYFLKSLRKDNENASVDLKAFLDDYRPIAEHEVKDFYQPPFG